MNIRFIDRRHARRIVLAIATMPALPFYVGMVHAQTSTAPATSTSPSASPSTLLPAPPPSPAISPRPAAPYRSAMEGYQPYTDEKIIDWKQANDSTGRIGGWREYAKEAQQTDARGAGSKPAPDAKPVSDAKPVKP